MTEEPEPTSFSRTAQRMREEREESLEEAIENTPETQDKSSKPRGRMRFGLKTLLALPVIYGAFLYMFSGPEISPRELFSSFKNVTEQYDKTQRNRTVRTYGTLGLGLLFEDKINSEGLETWAMHYLEQAPQEDLYGVLGNLLDSHSQDNGRNTTLLKVLTKRGFEKLPDDKKTLDFVKENLGGIIDATDSRFQWGVGGSSIAQYIVYGFESNKKENRDTFENIVLNLHNPELEWDWSAAVYGLPLDQRSLDTLHTAKTSIEDSCRDMYGATPNEIKRWPTTKMTAKNWSDKITDKDQLQRWGSDPSGPASTLTFNYLQVRRAITLMEDRKIRGSTWESRSEDVSLGERRDAIKKTAGIIGRETYGK